MAVTSQRIQYRCRECPKMFCDAQSSNAHHDATGHHQTFKCPTCTLPLSGHTDGQYERCMTPVGEETERWRQVVATAVAEIEGLAEHAR